MRIKLMKFKDPERVVNWTHRIMYVVLAAVMLVGGSVHFVDAEVKFYLGLIALACALVAYPTLYMATCAIRQQSDERLAKRLAQIEKEHQADLRRLNNRNHALG